MISVKINHAESSPLITGKHDLGDHSFLNKNFTLNVACGFVDPNDDACPMTVNAMAVSPPPLPTSPNADVTATAMQRTQIHDTSVIQPIVCGHPHMPYSGAFHPVRGVTLLVIPCQSAMPHDAPVQEYLLDKGGDDNPAGVDLSFIRVVEIIVIILLLPVIVHRSIILVRNVFPSLLLPFFFLFTE